MIHIPRLSPFSIVGYDPQAQEWGIAVQGEGAVVSREALAWQFPDELDRTLALLTRRELIETTDGGYRFQVELIRRWFARQVE